MFLIQLAIKLLFKFSSYPLSASALTRKKVQAKYAKCALKLTNKRQ